MPLRILCLTALKHQPQRKVLVKGKCKYIVAAVTSTEETDTIRSLLQWEPSVVVMDREPFAIYWNSELFMEQVRTASQIAKFKYSRETYSLVWIFDQSSGHCAYEADALNVNRTCMNVQLGRKQAILRATINPVTRHL